MALGWWLLSCALSAAQESTGSGEDGLETWVGGGVSAVGEVGSGVAIEPLGTQLELSAAIGWRGGFARVDVDLHVDSAGEVLGDKLFAYPGSYGSDPKIPMPEWAMVQFGRGDKHLRVGLLNPNFGIEDWDPWNNYAIGYSINYGFAGPGRVIGAEASVTTPSGYDLFAYGGFDPDYGTNTLGVGVATEQDQWATWSGLFFYPSQNLDVSGGCPEGVSECSFVGASVAAEYYPFADSGNWMTLALDDVTGFRGDAFFSSNHLVVNFIPDAAVNPYLRAEHVFDPKGVLGAPDEVCCVDSLHQPDLTVTVGVRSDLTDWMRVAAEGSSAWVDGSGYYGAKLLFAVHAPEPSPYSYQEPFTVGDE